MSTRTGPASVIFSNPNAAVTTAAFAAPGVYVLRLTANDSALSGSNTVQITVNDGGPTLAPIADRTIQLGTRFQQLLVASDSNINDTLTYALIASPARWRTKPSSSMNF